MSMDDENDFNPQGGQLTTTVTINVNTPKYELKETNHGTDGLDATTKLVARFDTKELAEAWLARREYTYKEYGSYSHADPNKRHCMGKISYTITEDSQVPENPQ